MQNNKEVFEVNSNINQRNEVANEGKKSKTIAVLVLIVVILIGVVVLCVGNMYAQTNNYDNVYAMVTGIISREEKNVVDEELKNITYIENTEEFGGEVRLLEDNKCIIDYGSMTGEIFTGKYEISGQTLRCELTKLIGDNIKDLEIDIKYYFDIIDSENIKFRCVIGSVGKYHSTLPGEDGKTQGEYEFKEEWHFSEGETFTLE